MYRLALIALAGCGRIGFDAAVVDAARDTPQDTLSLTDVVPLGHDEDGDGIRDTDDTCPHMVGPQTDSDGDGVGDLCDPNLQTGIPDRIALFYTMAPGDEPFASGPDDAVWMQGADAFAMVGDQGADNNLFGHIEMPVAFGNVRVVIGMNVTAVLPVTGSAQNQVALAVYATSPNYFVELNQIPSMYTQSAISYWDGAMFYMNADFDTLATGIHTGDLTLDTTQRVNTGVVFTSGWPGESYMEMVSDTLYQGATKIEMNMNNMHIEIRYLIVITSP